MRPRPRRLHALNPRVDAFGLEQADQDGKRAVPLDLLKVNHLLRIDLADDDPRKLHLHGHKTSCCDIGLLSGSDLFIIGRHQSMRLARVGCAFGEDKQTSCLD